MFGMDLGRKDYLLIKKGIILEVTCQMAGKDGI